MIQCIETIHLWFENVFNVCGLAVRNASSLSETEEHNIVMLQSARKMQF